MWIDGTGNRARESGVGDGAGFPIPAPESLLVLRVRLPLRRLGGEEADARVRAVAERLLRRGAAPAQLERLARLVERHRVPLGVDDGHLRGFLGRDDERAGL